MPSGLADRDSIRTELRVLQEEQGKALAMAAYVHMSTEQAKQFDDRRDRICELILLLATQS